MIKVNFETKREDLIDTLRESGACPGDIIGDGAHCDRSESDLCNKWANCEECWSDFVDRVTVQEAPTNGS
jgi:hypothetical protein